MFRSLLGKLLCLVNHVWCSTNQDFQWASHIMHNTPAAGSSTSGGSYCWIYANTQTFSTNPNLANVSPALWGRGFEVQTNMSVLIRSQWLWRYVHHLSLVCYQCKHLLIEPKHKPKLTAKFILWGPWMSVCWLGWPSYPHDTINICTK